MTGVHGGGRGETSKKRAAHPSYGRDGTGSGRGHGRAAGRDVTGAAPRRDGQGGTVAGALTATRRGSKAGEHRAQRRRHRDDGRRGTSGSAPAAVGEGEDECH